MYWIIRYEQLGVSLVPSLWKELIYALLKVIRLKTITKYLRKMLHCKMSKMLTWASSNSCHAIIFTFGLIPFAKGFRTIVFIFIVISTTFRPICPLAFFRCLSNSETFTELSSKFCEGSRVRQTPEEGRRTYRPKRCGNNNKDNRPKTLNDKNSRSLSRNFELRPLLKPRWSPVLIPLAITAYKCTVFL